MTRRDRNAEATRHVILEAAREIFSQHPYSDVSGMQICDHAGVPRGALQHHFGSKVGVFMAVFEDLQQGVYLQTVEAIGQQRQPWEKLRAGIAAFLDACTQPAYQTVVLIEGPAAIGWERWRELDAEYYGNLAQGFATMLAPAGSSEYASAMLVAAMRGTLAELSFAIAHSGDPQEARQEAVAVLDKLLHGMRHPTPQKPTGEPIRIGIGQLGTSAGTYVDQAATGQTFDITRRGHVLARLQRPTS